MKKILAMILVVLMVTAMFAGCGTTAATPTTAAATTAAATTAAATTAAATTEATTTEAATTAAATESTPAVNDGEILPLRWYMPGSPTPQADLVNAAVTAKMQADGLRLDFQPKYIPWDQWVNKINITLSSGEEFELLNIMEDYITTSSYTSRGGLTPLDDLIDQNAPDMWKLFDKVLWSCATVGGKVMTVPAYWRDNSGDGEGVITYSKTRFDEYGLTIPKTMDEMLTTMVTLQEKQTKATGIKSYMYEHSLNRCPVALHRAYASWPFYASQDGIYKVTQDGTASLFFESDEFKMDCEFMNKAYKLGLVHPDILNLPPDTINANKTAGDTLMNLMTGGGDVLKPGTTEILNDFSFFWLNPEGSFLCNLPLLNSNAVPSTAKHPEAGLKFLNWLYSNKVNHDLLLYGIEGQQWKAVGDAEYERIKDANGANLYAFDYWMVEYVPLHRFDVNRTTDAQADKDYISNVFPNQTVYSPVVGFNFDSEKVAVEFANMMAEYTTSMLPIKLGVIPYAGNYEAALSKMKAAGSDAVIAEYQKQLAAYIAAKK